MVKAMVDKIINRNGFDNHNLKCYKKVSSAAGGFVILFYSNIENLVLRARSEMIGFAIGQVCSWFQVSGFRCQ